MWGGNEDGVFLVLDEIEKDVQYLAAHDGIKPALSLRQGPAALAGG